MLWPLLANVFLHYVLDVWFDDAVVPRMRGRASLVRFADDAVCVFENRHDSQRVRTVLEKRLAKYGLTLHPTKTRIVAFAPGGQGPGPTQDRTFEFLGFTHHWKRSRRGNWIVARRTARTRLRRALRKVYTYCRRHRHRPLRQQQAYLSRLLRGHYAYYGIVGNSRCLQCFAYQVRRIWHKWLKRRNGLRRLTWARFNGMLQRLTLPEPRIVQTFGRSP